MGTHKLYRCYFDADLAAADGGLLPGFMVTGCAKYNLRHFPVCITCDAGYDLVYANGTSVDN